jgi:hypothetical protein
VSNYLSVADTAKLVRQALKESFPGVKFSVRSHSYAGGASIDVRWTDGPNSKQVDSVLDQFEGAYFDGMIDYKGSRYHKLDGEPIHFGADFVQGYREHSDAAIERAFRTIKVRYPGNFEPLADQISVDAFKRGKLWNVIFFPGGDFSSASVQTVINQQLHKQSDRIAPNKSATLDRISFAGDDGYGAGTVGHDGKSGENAYRAQEEARERAAAAERLRAGAPVARVSADLAAFVDPTGELRKRGIVTLLGQEVNS